MGIYYYVVVNSRGIGMREENAKIQMRKGIMEYCVLAILANGDEYAPAIISELKSA